MNCNNRMVYTVQDGDSLYQLARQFDTTVTDLILGNPGVNPYNLQVGMRLNICPGRDENAEMNGNLGMNNRPGMPGMPSMPGMNNRPGMPSMPGMNNRPGIPGMPQTPGMNNRPDMENGETSGEIGNEVEQLMREMRLAWLDLIFWNRMYLMSVDSGSEDQQEIEERLMQAVDEITDVFAEFLPVAATRQLRNLLAEHVELGGELIRMRKEGNMQSYDEVAKAWYANANQIAELFAQLNPYFGGREVRNMLLNYLDLTRESIEQQISGAYGDSIESFRDLKTQVLDMADYFARGLLAR